MCLMALSAPGPQGFIGKGSGTQKSILENQFCAQERSWSLGIVLSSSSGLTYLGPLGPGQLTFHLWVRLFWLPNEKVGQGDFRKLKCSSWTIKKAEH